MVWDAKYTFWSPRPDTVIRDLGLAPRWKPYLKTPFFPSYVSGHSAFSAAAAEVLAYLFPDRAREFRARAREAAMSRLYGGIHFRSDNEVGLRMGRELGQLVVKRAKRDGARNQ
jgi:membrane-associated phospholipid phosphatase